MIVPLHDILLTLPCLVGFLFLFYLAGTALFLTANKHRGLFFTAVDLQVLFWRLFTGLSFLCSVYAIVITRFQTCLLPVPLLLYFFCRDKRQVASLEQSYPVSKNAWLYCLLAILIYWIFFVSRFISADADSVNYIAGDSSFYGRLADFINTAGRETSTPDGTGMMPARNEPYHYGDIWLVALIKRLTGLHAILITYAVAYPVLAVIAVTGVASYIREFSGGRRIKSIHFILLLTGFVNGLAFLLVYFYPGYDSLSVSLVMRPKLFLVTSILAGILLLLRESRWTAALVVTCIGSLLFTTIAPGIFLTTFLVVLFACLRNRETIRPAIPGILATILTGLFLFFFYREYLRGEGDDTAAGYNLKTGGNILLGGLSQFAALLPFLILLFLLYRYLDRKGNRQVVFLQIRAADLQFLVLLPFIGLAAWILSYTQSYDAVQLFQNVFQPILVIAIMMILAATFYYGNSILRIAASLLLLASIALNYKFHFDRESIPAHELASVKTFLGKYPAGHFVNTRSWEGANAFTKNTVSNQPLIFLDYLVHPYVNISLDIPSPETVGAEKYTAQIKKITEDSPFGLYIKKNTEGSIPGKAYDFVVEKKIRFLSTDERVPLPPGIVPLLKDSVAIPSMRWKIYYLAW